MPDFGRWTANGGDPSLNDINRADKFLDALAAEQPVFSTDRDDADLAFLLQGWRDEVRQVPMEHVVTPSQATAALVDATSAPTRRNRFGLAVVGSAAAAVLCLGGFGTAVFAAAPGDGLYGVRSMLFGEERATRDDAVVLAAQTELAQVQQLVDQGQWGPAQDKLAALSATVQSVDRVEQKQELIQQWNALTYKVVAQDPAATLPPVGEPLPVLPASPLTLLPVPVIEETPTTSVSDSPVSTTVETTGPEVLSTTPPEATTSETAPAETSAPPASEAVTPTTSAAPTATTSAPGTTVTSTTVTSTPAPSTTAAPTTSAAPSTSAATTSAAPTTTVTTTTVTATATTTTATKTPAATTTTTVVSSVAAPSPAAPEQPAVEEAPAEPTPSVLTTTTTVPAGLGR